MPRKSNLLKTAAALVSTLLVCISLRSYGDGGGGGTTTPYATVTLPGAPTTQYGTVIEASTNPTTMSATVSCPTTTSTDPEATITAAYWCSAGLQYKATTQQAWGPVPSTTQDTVTVTPGPTTEGATEPNFTVATTMPDPGYYQISVTGSVEYTDSDKNTYGPYSTTQPTNAYFTAEGLHIVDNAWFSHFQRSDNSNSYDSADGGTFSDAISSNMSFVAQVSPSDQAPSATYQWTVPGTKMWYYHVYSVTLPNDHAEVVAVPNLTSPGIAYCWVDAGQGRSVSLKATVDGLSVTRSVTANIFAPNLYQSFSSLEDVTHIARVPTWVPWGGFIGGWGPPTSYNNLVPGLGFGGIVGDLAWSWADFPSVGPSAPLMGTGSYCWVQVINNTDSTLTFSSPMAGVVQERLAPSFGLDTTFPTYSGRLFADSPGDQISNNIAQMAVTEAFTKTLMFNAAGGTTGSNWVPIAKSDWSWSFTANRTPAGAYAGPTNQSDSGLTATTTFPVWTQLAGTGVTHWVPN